MQHDSTKYHIAKLIYKSIAMIITDKENEDLNKWLSEEKNKVFYNKITDSHTIRQKLDLYNQADPEKIYKRLEQQILADQKRKSKPRYLKIYKYAAAAIVVGMLATGYFFRDNFYESPIDNPPIIVNTNTIVPGSDKATLTLEDGSVVRLEKGNTYQTPSAKSNGEQLVYEVKNTKSKDIVYNYLTIPRGGQFYIKLSDGTQVWLNSETQLKYPVNFLDGETRQVELVYGEAYFDVSPSIKHNGADFKVYNSNQEVHVLGTEFNLKAYKDETNIYTTLVEGKVVIGNGISKFDLVPNQQSNLNIENNSLTIAEVDVNAEISWKNGIFSFKGMQLKAIMKVISRWYDVDVIFENENLESIKFKGSLDKQQSIEEILSIMKSSSISDYEIKNKTIILK